MFNYVMSVQFYVYYVMFENVYYVMFVHADDVNICTCLLCYCFMYIRFHIVMFVVNILDVWYVYVIQL